VAFLVAALGAWWGWVDRAWLERPAGLRSSGRALGSLTQAPSYAKIPSSWSGDNPAARASRTFSHWQNGLAKRAPESVTKWHRTEQENQSSPNRVAHQNRQIDK
jgi:hypothetical protein